MPVPHPSPLHAKEGALLEAWRWRFTESFTAALIAAGRQFRNDDELLDKGRQLADRQLLVLHEELCPELGRRE